MTKGDRDRHEFRENVLLALGCFVLLVWAVAILVPLAFPSREKVDGQVHVIALVVAVGLFGAAGLSGLRSNGGGGGGGSSRPKDPPDA